MKKDGTTTSQVTGNYVEFQAAVLRALPRDIEADVAYNWTQNGESLTRVLREALMPNINPPIWKTIKLGTGLKTADDFRKALKQSGCEIGDWGNDILGKPAFKASDTEIEVNLVNVSVAELGFKNGATRRDIYNKAIELGLELCPNEVGPQLRLQYKDQPLGERLRIAMEPISDSVGGLDVFSVEHDVDDLWLRGSDGGPDLFWDGYDRFVFLRPLNFLHFSS